MENNRIYQNVKYFLVIALSVLAITVATFSSAAVTHTISYIYDNLDRITAINYGDGISISYSYDDAGNILHVEMNGTGSTMELLEAIISLQISAGQTPDITQSNLIDLNGDGKIGVEEAINILRIISESNP